MVLAITTFFLLLLALSGIVAAQPPINSAGVGCRTTLPFLLAQSDYGGDFDLSYCQWECRMRFGFEPTGNGGGGGLQSETEDGNGAYETHQSSGTYNQYAACIADCQRKFWADFDKTTGNIGKTPSTRP